MTLHGVHIQTMAVLMVQWHGRFDEAGVHVEPWSAGSASSGGVASPQLTLSLIKDNHLFPNHIYIAVMREESQPLEYDP